VACGQSAAADSSLNIENLTGGASLRPVKELHTMSANNINNILKGKADVVLIGEKSPGEYFKTHF
jgi:hypothetical protein